MRTIKLNTSSSSVKSEASQRGFPTRPERSHMLEPPWRPLKSRLAPQNLIKHEVLKARLHDGAAVINSSRRLIYGWNWIHVFFRPSSMELIPQEATGIFSTFTWTRLKLKCSSGVLNYPVTWEQVDQARTARRLR